MREDRRTQLKRWVAGGALKGGWGGVGWGATKKSVASDQSFHVVAVAADE